MEYKVNLEKFTGPLDLLLSLIEEKKMAIGEISLAQVADQFLEYLKKIESDVSSEYQRILADFLVVASRLILIKSRSLLPNLVLSEEEVRDIKDLEERLKTYQQIKTLGRALGKWIRCQTSFISRDSYFDLPITFYPPKNVSLENLAMIYENFLKTLPQVEKLEEQSLKKIITLEEKIKELSSRVGEAMEASFTDISSGVKSKIDVILTFLALLMLFRNRILEVSQDKLFGDIKIKRVDNNI
ncbi:MAG: segregation/condensation protein A [Patescibacteria group bacterium]